MPLGPVEYLRSRGHNLYPGQSLALKLMYGESLDGNQKVFEIRSSWLDLVDILSETEYFRLLSQLGRSNSASGTPNPDGYRRVFLAMGRHSGKTQLISLMNVYEAYLHTEYGGVYSSMNLTLNDNLARILTHNFRENIGREQLITVETSTRISCEWTSSASNFFFQDMHRQSTQYQYDSLAFDDPAFSRYMTEDPTLLWLDSLRTSGKLMVVSTPNGRDPFFHRQCTIGQGMGDTLVLQIPTWEANPLMLPQVIQEHSRGEPTFDRDYGASFNTVYNHEPIEEWVVVEQEPHEVVEQEPIKSRFHIIEEFNA